MNQNETKNKNCPKCGIQWLREVGSTLPCPPKNYIKFENNNNTGEWLVETCRRCEYSFKYRPLDWTEEKELSLIAKQASKFDLQKTAKPRKLFRKG